MNGTLEQHASDVSNCYAQQCIGTADIMLLQEELLVNCQQHASNKHVTAKLVLHQ